MKANTTKTIGTGKRGKTKALTTAPETPKPTAAEAFAIAAAAYDANRESSACPMSEIAETLDVRCDELLRAVGLLTCSLQEGGDVDGLAVERAISIVVDVREAIRVCVRDELALAGVLPAADQAVTS